jgi:hypothetical protein
LQSEEEIKENEEKVQNWAKTVEARMKETDGENEEEGEKKQAAKPEKKDGVSLKEEKKPEIPQAQKAKDGKKEAEDVELSKRLAIISRREGESKQRVHEAEGKLKAREQEIEAFAKKAQTVVDGIQIASRDPIRFYEEVMGIKGAALEPIAKALYYHAAGLEAPADVRTSANMTRLEHQMQTLMNQNQELRDFIQNDRQSQAQDREAGAYRDRVESYVKNLPEEMTYLKAFAEEDSSQVINSFLEHAADLMERGGLEEGDPPSPQEVAEALEAATKARYEKLFGKKAVAEKNGKPKQKPSPTLSEKDLTTHSETRTEPKDNEEKIREFAARMKARIAERELS